MQKYRCELGFVDGVPYKLIHDRRYNQCACDNKYSNEWRWFLWVGGLSSEYYVGDFKLKRDALNYLKGA